MMAKAYVFPGQGAQFPGMGRDLFESDEKAHGLFELADEILGFGLTDIMFEGSAQDLLRTKVTQPAVFVHSVVSALCSGEESGPDMVAGHSLGEYSALVVAGALSFEDGLRLVAARAEAMQQCCEANPGTMAAVIGLADEVVENLCAEVAAESGGVLVAANYNSPGNITISGDVESVELAGTRMKEAGAMRVIPLSVGGAFHSPLMRPAGDRLADAISSVHFGRPFCPVYQNVDALPHTAPEELKANLLAQLTSPVRWTDQTVNMISDGMTGFIEYGPGTVLTGLIARIRKTLARG